MRQTTNPATGEPLETYEEHGEESIAAMLARSWRCYEDWRRTSYDERASLLRRVADLLDDQLEDHARQVTLEMGKPITQSRAEIDKCAWLARHYADEGAAYLEPDRVETDATRSYVRYDPLGPILAIMPWNFPYWQVMRHAVPAAMAGNTILLKHAEATLGVGYRIEQVFRDAGFPEHFLQHVVISHEQVEAIAADDRVRGLTLTGSVGAGASVGRLAGANIKKSVLELGGSDPFIVLDDADLEEAARIGAKARLQNTGQSCIAAKRFIVQASVYDDYVERLRAEMEAMTVGDPLEEETEMGPMAREDLRDELHDQVQRAAKDGGTIVCGGRIPDRSGYFYPATIITDVTSANPAGSEELFGPAATVFRVTDDEEAIAVANASPFGLGASVWTADLERGEEVARWIDAGVISVNEMVKSDPRLPFGGVKDSGYGRELGQLGAREFTNAKTVWVAGGSAPGGGQAE